MGQGAERQFDMLGGIFTERLGQQLADAMLTKDWSGVGETLAKSLGQTLSQAFASAGPFGQFFGGLAGGLLQGVLTKALDRFGGKAAPSEFKGDISKVQVVNWPKALEAGITLMPINMLRGSGAANITVNAANADSRNLARSLISEMQTT